MPDVAVSGEVVAVIGSSGPGGAGGTWRAGLLSETAYPRLTVGGTPVIYEAQCTFVFTDTVTGATTTSVVTLQASTTLLRGESSGVLRNGDTAIDDHGNTLAVQITRPPVLLT